MTKFTSTPTSAVLVGIDMSKNPQGVLIERPEGGRRRRMTVMVTKHDYDGFAEQLAAIGRPIVVGFEATGNCHRTLAHRLLTAGFELRLISSVALARTRDALHKCRRLPAAAQHFGHWSDQRTDHPGRGR